MAPLPQVLACVASYLIGWHIHKRRSRRDVNSNRYDLILAQLHRTIRPKQVFSRNSSSRTLREKGTTLSGDVERSCVSESVCLAHNSKDDESEPESIVCLPPTHPIFSVIKMLQQLQVFSQFAAAHPPLQRFPLRQGNVECVSATRVSLIIYPTAQYVTCGVVAQNKFHW